MGCSYLSCFPLAIQEEFWTMVQITVSRFENKRAELLVWSIFPERSIDYMSWWNICIVFVCLVIVFSCKGWWYSCIILTVVCKIQKDIKPVFFPRIKFLSEKPIVLRYNTTGSLANKIRTYSWSKKNIRWLIIGKILWHRGKNPREARHW